MCLHVRFFGSSQCLCWLARDTQVPLLAQVEPPPDLPLGGVLACVCTCPVSSQAVFFVSLHVSVVFFAHDTPNLCVCAQACFSTIWCLLVEQPRPLVCCAWCLFFCTCPNLKPAFPLLGVCLLSSHVALFAVLGVLAQIPSTAWDGAPRSFLETLDAA